jgi:hypothetical protein
MPKGPRGEKRPADAIGRAVMVARIATGEVEDNAIWAPLRRLSALARTMPKSRRFAAPIAARGRYSPAVCTGIHKTRIEGKPDGDHVSTSYVERANLSIRMQHRRFTRLTDAVSKKFQNHVHMLALYFAFYNFVRIHKTLRGHARDGGWRGGHALDDGRHCGADRSAGAQAGKARALQEEGIAMRRVVFWTSVAVAIIAPLVSLRWWLWLPYIDAPELVAPVVGASIVGAIVFAAALITAWVARPISN